MAEQFEPPVAPILPSLFPQPNDTHTPANPSPLNPASRQPSKTQAPVQREQREKKESLKKRESNVNGTASSSALGKRKANSLHSYPSPQRFNVPQPKAQDFEPPKDDLMFSHEPTPFLMPDGETELLKPTDLAENKRGYRYGRAIADPLFPHKQFYRSTSPPPHHAHLSFEDADKWMHFTSDAMTTTNEKGWRMCRANVCAREGTTYYEVKIQRGVPPSGPDPGATGPQPHVRFGWARREAPLDAPVGFDGYSYGITDARFETMHRSRPGKFFHPRKPTKAKSAKGGAAGPVTVTLAPEDAHVKEGDVIGLELQLPSLSLHQKVVSGVYNPAVDTGDGFPDLTFDPSSLPSARDPHGDDVLDVIRDRIPVTYKGNSYFETLDHVAHKPMENYADRTLNVASLTQTSTSGQNKDALRTAPNPNHEHAALRTLPQSAIRVYKNGQLIGTAFENLLAFLPPASAPSKVMGAREGFDDGMIGYFPAIACFWGGIVEVNFGDGPEGFWAPPAHVQPTQSRVKEEMDGSSGYYGSGGNRWLPGRNARGVGERYKEQVAEDIIWDLIDEVDFFIQDGGYEGKVGQGAVEGGSAGIMMED